MKCYLCENDLGWENDFRYEDFGMDGKGVVSILICNNKECDVECIHVYVNLDDKEDSYI